jgi:hypothetical protein
VVVLDLDDPACVDRLRDEQRRRRDQLLNRCRALGVVAALPVTALVWWIFYSVGLILGTIPVVSVLTGVAAGAAFVLERTYGARRFFPYLDLRDVQR